MAGKLRMVVSAVARSLAGNFDRRDAVGAIGLGLLGYGLAQVYAPLAAIVPGAVLVYVALFWKA